MFGVRIAWISMTAEVTTNYCLMTPVVNVSGVGVTLIPKCIHSPALSFSVSSLPDATIEATSSP
jgi:hypothetical protein